MLSSLPCFPTFCCSAILTGYCILNGLYYLFTLNFFSTPAGAEKSTAISSITELYLICVSIGCHVIISCACIQITKWHPKQAYTHRTSFECFMKSLESYMDQCTAHCKEQLFCMKTVMKESRKFELASLKKK